MQHIPNVQKMLLVSESADVSDTPTGAMIACLAVLVLDINSNDISEFRSTYRQWQEQANKFATRFGFATQFKAVSKRVVRGDDLFGDDDDVEDLGKAIVKNRVSIYADTRIEKSLYTLLVKLGRCLIKDNPSAWAYVEKNISAIKNTRLTSIFLSDEDEPTTIDGLDPNSASQDMRKLYQKITGGKPTYGYALDPRVLKQLREDKPQLMEEYARLNKVLNREVKRLVFRYVRNKQKVMVPVDEVSKFLEKQNVLHNMPRGFTGGQVDENMKFYTAEGHELDKAPVGLVRMNPKYDPAQNDTYVLYAQVYGKSEKGGDVSSGRIRTVTMNAANKVKRHAAVSDFLDNEEKIRAKWLKDLKRKGTKEQMMAMMVELLYVTSARIGGKGNKSKGETTYGLTTLTGDHVAIKGNSLHFNYMGKKGAAQPSKYPLGTAEGRLIAEIMKKRLTDIEPGELVFTFRGKAIIRHAISKYLKSLGTQLSPHDFRRSTGTKMARQLLAKNPFTARAKKGEKLKESEVNKWFATQMTEIGAKLHHTTGGDKIEWKTAVKSYIDPQVVHNFYDSLGVRPPSAVPKAGSSAGE